LSIFSSLDFIRKQIHGVVMRRWVTWLTLVAILWRRSADALCRNSWRQTWPNNWLSAVEAESWHSTACA